MGNFLRKAPPKESRSNSLSRYERKSPNPAQAGFFIWTSDQSMLPA